MYRIIPQVDLGLGIFSNRVRSNITTPLKLYDKGYNCFSQRITTIKEQLGHDIDMERVVGAIEKAFIQKFGVSLEEDEPNRWEKNLIDDFINNTKTFQINDARQLPIFIPN